ncbi:MAG: tetratricopeptide repeat protein, partial [Candidatus Aminicenantaceae bacterium]
DKALEEFENAIALEPSDPESYYEAGIILLAQKNTTKAVMYFEKYLYLGGERGDEVQKLLKKIKS